MKRQIVLISVLILLFAGLVFGVIYLNDPTIFRNNNNATHTEPSVSYVMYPVYNGEIVRTYELSSQVILGDPRYLVEIKLSNATDSNFEMFLGKGDSISPNEPLYKYNDETKSVDFNGLITDIVREKSDTTQSVAIRLLNYDALYITVQTDLSKYAEINYDTSVNVIYKGQKYASEIVAIGWEVINNKIPVKVALPIKLLPGTDITVEFVLSVQKAGVYVLEEAIYQDGGHYYANVSNGNDSSVTRRAEVTIGQRFELEEDGHVWNFVELISGVNDGDVLVVETIAGPADLGSVIKDVLKNG